MLKSTTLFDNNKLNDIFFKIITDIYLYMCDNSVCLPDRAAIYSYLKTFALNSYYSSFLLFICLRY